MAEYPFKDLLPLDEVLEREDYYNDWTHLDPEVFYSLTQISEYIKTKGYGVDVRLLISQLAEHFGLRVTQITDAMNEFNDLKPKAELSVSQSAEALTKSQSALNVANSADTLSKSVQEQFNQVIIDGDSSVEAAQARVDASGQTNATLKARLDKEHNEVTAQLAQTDYKLRPKQLKPLIAFTIDDGVIQDLDIFDVSQQYTIPFTTAIISSRVGTNGYLSQQQIKTMENAGWEVTSHSKSHVALPDLSVEQLELEVRDSKKSLLEMGFNVKSICLPFGRTSEQVRNVVPKYYRSMRVSGLANNGVINYPPIDTFGINSVTLGDSSGTDNAIDPESGLMVDTLPYWKYLVDKAKASNGLLIFISHGEPLKLRLEELKQLFVYIQSLGIETVTLDEALDTFQNQVDTQKMKIGADGTVSGEYGKIRQAPYNTVLGDTNIKDIAREMVTYNTVTENAGQNSGMPNQTGGTLLVVNPDNRPDRSFQLLKSQGIDGGLFLKEFDRNGIASSYRQLDTVYVHPANSVKSNHTLSDLKRGRLNYCAIYASGASGYPRSEAGLLIADDLVEGYFNETYITITGNKYKRNNIGDAWRTVLDITPLSLNSQTANSPIATYPNGISYAQISAGGASTFPEGKAGMLETHKITVNGYNFQYYHIYNETKTYKRVVRNDGTWTDFVLM